MAGSEPEVVHNQAAGRFEIHQDGETAFAEYRLERGQVAFPHTVVPEALEGHGLGSALVRAGMAWAKDADLPVAPYCSFFQGYITRHPEYASQLTSEWRAKLDLKS